MLNALKIPDMRLFLFFFFLLLLELTTERIDRVKNIIFGKWRVELQRNVKVMNNLSYHNWSSCQIKQSYCSFSCSFSSLHRPIPCFSTNVCVVLWCAGMGSWSSRKMKPFLLGCFSVGSVSWSILPHCHVNVPDTAKKRANYQREADEMGKGQSCSSQNQWWLMLASNAVTVQLPYQLEFYSEHVGFAHTRSFFFF